MNVDKLTRLFQAFGQAVNSSPAQESKSRESAAATTSGNSAAVSLAPGFGSGQTAESRAQDRSQRVQELKAQVQSGNYKPDTSAVAQAVARDLL